MEFLLPAPVYADKVNISRKFKVKMKVKFEIDFRFSNLFVFSAQRPRVVLLRDIE